jgi:hypothetical protein
VTGNRNGLVVDTRVTLLAGTGERRAAAHIAAVMGQRNQHATLGADRAYDTHDFVAKLRELKITLHVANTANRRSAIDGRTARHERYAISRRNRKRVEEVWLDEDHRPTAQDALPRPGSFGMDVHLRRGSLQSGSQCLKRPEITPGPLLQAPLWPTTVTAASPLISPQSI